MKTNLNPQQLAIDLLDRSECNVQVAAVLADKWGIFSWGWNHVGKGFGCHAEAHCFQRANKKRMQKATLFVAARRKKHKKMVIAKPCRECERLTINVSRVVWRDKDGQWK